MNKAFILTIVVLFGLFILWMVFLGGITVDGKRWCKAETNWKLQTKLEMDGCR